MGVVGGDPDITSTYLDLLSVGIIGGGADGTTQKATG